MGTFIRTLSLVVLLVVGATAHFEFKHHNQQELVQILDDVSERCKTITRRFTLEEKSVGGVPLEGISFGPFDTPDERIEWGDSESPFAPVPGFKWVGNMHGNEVVGRELLLALVFDLCNEYPVNRRVKRLITTTRIHILPTMNPDGYAKAVEKMDNGNASDDLNWVAGRKNNHDVDLNRNFPNLNEILYKKKSVPYPMSFNFNAHEPETRALMKWILDGGVSLGANLHGGDLVANYPYDESIGRTNNVYTKAPDDALFKVLAKSYSESHATMASKKRVACDPGAKDDYFPDGITNGAAWYSLTGGMQDFNYLASNNFELTLELGCVKFPKAEKLKQIWRDNKAAMYNYMNQVHRGVKGFVKGGGSKIKDALITVVGPNGEKNTHPIRSGPNGEYFRLLLPGTYQITASANSFRSQTKTVTVEKFLTKNPKDIIAKRVDFVLTHKRRLTQRRPSAKEILRELDDLEKYEALQEYLDRDERQLY